MNRLTLLLTIFSTVIFTFACTEQPQQQTPESDVKDKNTQQEQQLLLTAEQKAKADEQILTKQNQDISAQAEQNLHFHTQKQRQTKEQNLTKLALESAQQREAELLKQAKLKQKLEELSLEQQHE